ncbi:MAG: DUF6364 family protein [Bacteroidia bacterium]
MNAKLTLKLNQEVIEKAKAYAKSNQTSLSVLVENYLQTLTLGAKDKKSRRKITPLVKSLSGIINLPADYDHKKDYSDYLVNKYSDFKA